MKDSLTLLKYKYTVMSFLILVYWLSLFIISIHQNEGEFRLIPDLSNLTAIDTVLLIISIFALITLFLFGRLIRKDNKKKN